MTRKISDAAKWEPISWQATWDAEDDAKSIIAVVEAVDDRFKWEVFDRFRSFVSGFSRTRGAAERKALRGVRVIQTRRLIRAAK